MSVSLLVGGARSGKSSLAVARALAWQGLESGRSVTFIATGKAGDDEMHARIQRHQRERPTDWETVEAPMELASALELHNRKQPNNAVVIDCLSFWVANNLMSRFPVDALDSTLSACEAAKLEQHIVNESRLVVQTLRRSDAPSWIVTNEVGSGLVPDTPIGRLFRDVAGRVNATVSGLVDDAFLVVAGRVLRLEQP
jgi:adenosylcobinamide kinase / adenosylcobinamide-phosphate guanylyltransferase